MRVSHRGEEANWLFPWPGAVTVSSTSLFVSWGWGGNLLVPVSLVVFPAGHSVNAVPQGLLHSVVRTTESLSPGRACLLAHIPALFCFLNMLPFKDLPPFVLPL